MIKTGNIADIDCVLGITKSCARHMIKQGVYQWNEQYPDRDSFVNDVKNNELYVYLEKEKVVGCISLCNEMDEVYMAVRWKTINLNSLYIHRLAVHPNFQKKGVGKALMDFAENFARKKDYESVRLDTFSKNKRNLKFYNGQGR